MPSNHPRSLILLERGQYGGTRNILDFYTLFTDRDHCFSIHFWCVPRAPYNAELHRGPRSPSTSVHHLAFFVLTTFSCYYYNSQTLSGTKKIIPQRCQRIRRSPNAGSIEQHRLHRVSVGGTFRTAALLRNNFSKFVPVTQKSSKDTP